MRTLIQENGLRLVCCRSLRKDRELVLEALNHPKWEDENGRLTPYGTKDLLEELLHFKPFSIDKEIALAIVKKDGLMLEHVDKTLQKDRVIVLAAVGQNGLALQYADPELQIDVSILKVAYAQNPESLQFAIAAATKLYTTDITRLSETIEQLKSVVPTPSSS